MAESLYYQKARNHSAEVSPVGRKQNPDVGACGWKVCNKILCSREGWAAGEMHTALAAGLALWSVDAEHQLYPLQKLVREVTHLPMLRPFCVPSHRLLAVTRL